MPKLSPKSEERLLTCDQRLQRVAREAIKCFDFAVLTGHRGKEEQNEAFAAGNSKERWPDSKHNSIPSAAFDVAPFPIDWKDSDRFVLLAGCILGIAHTLGIKLRWGGDWNGNFKVSDERFLDLGHFELKE